LAQALQFAEAGPSDEVLDLGSGDGRFCIAAVQQFGVRSAVGVEIDQDLVRLSREKAEQCQVSDRATFTCADLTALTDNPALNSLLGRPTLVIVFLLPEAERQFQEVVMKLYDAGARVLSLAFELDRLHGLKLVRKQTPMFMYSRTADYN
jgi:ribosomal protein L11 methylase PrmA